MTVQELSTLRHLHREIEQEEARLSELRLRAYSPSGPSLSGMPRGGPEHSKVEQYAAALAEIEAGIQERIVRSTIEEARLRRYIETVPDAQMRNLLLCRFVDCCTWEQVAARCDFERTAYAVKKRVYRFIQKNP